MDKVPAVPKVRREPRRLRDIRGPSREATDFTQGQYGILVSRTRGALLPSLVRAGGWGGMREKPRGTGVCIWAGDGEGAGAGTPRAGDPSLLVHRLALSPPNKPATGGDCCQTSSEKLD